MADVKISALPASTTPLAGTEVLPIVQSGATVQVSVANLTAGRAVSASSLSLTSALPVASGGTGLSAGTSGGVLAFTATGTLASSAALAASALVIGGGAGVAPSTTTTATGALTFLGTPSSANLAALLTDETGTGANVFATSPTLTTPTISGYTESVVACGTAGVVGASFTFVITAGTVLTAILTASTPCTFTMPASPVAGQSFILRLTNSATGMTTATFTGVKWPGGTAPTITATASAVDIISFAYIGSTWYGNAAQAFA
jgi:hypothetical protein